jgi:hypothetical protein
MKCTIVSTSSLALIISLTLIATSNNYNIAFAQESYLKLKSAGVDYHNGDLDVDIQTEKNIPSEKGKRGFGYGVLTDVGDEFADNVLVAISDIGIQDYDRSAKNDKLHTHVLDLTGDISRACSDSDYEVAKSSSDNDAIDTVYPIDVNENKISISDVDVDDLASDTVKAITSFSAEAITHNDKVQHVCIDIQDTLKQPEISISYDTSNSNNNGNGNDNDDNDNNNRKEHDDDTKNDDNDDLFDIDIDQDIDVSNGCNNEANCDSEVNNEADIGDDIDIDSDSDNDGFDLDLGQIIDQSNDCTDSSTCSNEGNNEANFWENSDDSGEDDNEDIDIGQHIQQKNECNDEAECSNEGSNTANVFRSTPNDGDFDSDVDIDQSIEQSNICSGDSVCSNFANNITWASLNHAPQ